MRGVYLFGVILFGVLCFVTRGTEQTLCLVAQWLMIAFARLDETIAEAR
jgi:hypothetical protein